MKTLIRHAPTGKYFQNLDSWTANRSKAHDFKLIKRALKFISKAGFSDMELIVSLKKSERIEAIQF